MACFRRCACTFYFVARVSEGVGWAGGQPSDSLELEQHALEPRAQHRCVCRGASCGARLLRSSTGPTRSRGSPSRSTTASSRRTPPTCSGAPPTPHPRPLSAARRLASPSGQVHGGGGAQRHPPDTSPRRYIFATYWSLTTATTVGYGDITGESTHTSACQRWLWQTQNSLRSLRARAGGRATGIRRGGAHPALRSFCFSRRRHPDWREAGGHVHHDHRGQVRVLVWAVAWPLRSLPLPHAPGPFQPSVAAPDTKQRRHTGADMTLAPKHGRAPFLLGPQPLAHRPRSMFAYLMGSVSSLLASLNAADVRVTRKKALIEEFLARRKIPKRLGNKVKGYVSGRGARARADVIFASGSLARMAATCCPRALRPGDESERRMMLCPVWVAAAFLSAVRLGAGEAAAQGRGSAHRRAALQPQDAGAAAVVLPQAARPTA